MELGFDTRQELETYLFSIMSRLAVGPTQAHMYWAIVAVSPGTKRLGHETHHLRLVLRLTMVELYLQSLISHHGVVLN
jgi:hypothetical protein